MADREIVVPRGGRVVAKPTFRVIASMNPYDNVGTTRLSSSVHDRMCRLAVDYQDAEAEMEILAVRAPNTHASVSADLARSEEHTSELQSLMRISYAVFCLKKKKHQTSKKSN